eukprot:1316038-Amorphochlora_amoeboformis.AAC.1
MDICLNMFLVDFPNWYKPNPKLPTALNSLFTSPNVDTNSSLNGPNTQIFLIWPIHLNFILVIIKSGVWSPESRLRLRRSGQSLQLLALVLDSL